MTEIRKASRRSFLRQVAGGAVGIGALGLVGGDAAIAKGTELQSDTDPTDPARSDSDPTDPAVRPQARGCSDNDTGRRADPAGRGLRCRSNGRRYTGLTDRDTGPGADPRGYGTGRRRACSDSDTGRSDPARGARSDSDSGVRDPIGRGRRC